ncbi:brefeldin A-inhibited guanine nucleotide-exchange protein [Acrasis kona]|uniref:Brefeldin A-inhibited guanine nucleotide-exchange protein n=1 Tax=Acrasis kona TaxID=1008807 RepID=A0AAW2Z189_9EUKA
MKNARRYPVLKETCSKILGDGKSDKKSEDFLAHDMNKDPNKYFKPIELACQTKNPEMIEVALDCLQKMMMMGYIDGKSKYENDQNQLLIDVVIHTVGSCFEPNQKDAVQLNIIKNLLTAVTSCDVHGKSLRLTVKTCFNIHLVSKNEGNQKVAKGALTQMLNTIFQKMENQLLHQSKTNQSLAADQTQQTNGSHQVEENQDQEKTTHQHVSDVVSDILEKVSERFEESPTEVKQQAADDAQHLSEELVENVTLTTSSSTTTEQPPSIPTNMSDNEAESSPIFDNQYQKDAFFIFRALCRLSMKKLPANATNESIEMRSRVLALQLIHSVLENSGPVFRNTHFFITDIREFLCLSLLKNSVSTVPSIFNLSLSIFKTLILYFKNHFKTEIGMFFTSAFLRILESNNSTYQQKYNVIIVLHNICQDSQTIVDLFVNYDCALESLNIYESLVSDLSRVAQQIQAEANWVTPVQEAKIKFCGLQTIVSILKSLVEWTDRRGQDQSQIEPGTTIGDEHSLPDTPTNGSSSSSSNQHAFNEQQVARHNRESLFEKQRHYKMDLREGIALFNTAKPNKGIQHLINAGQLKQDPKEIAQFLYTQEGLSKKSIGEYIGQPADFIKDVREAFVDLQRPTFRGKEFLSAFRNFLNTLRLPGEAQMIDRTLVSFASGYYGENQDDVFANADAVYVFAYAIIMLNVELHSPQLNFRSRMTVEQFINNNAGTNDGSDLSPEFQAEMYNNVKNCEIVMKEEMDAKQLTELDPETANLSTPKKKQLLFERESNQIYKKTRERFSSNWNTSKNKSNLESDVDLNSTFFNASGIQHVRPMFEVSWQPILEALMDEKVVHSDDPLITQLCLDGLEFGIRISSRFDMPTERDAFVGALAKLTNLHHASAMKPRNIDAIKLMLKIADVEGNFLKESWIHVLTNCSQLERLISIASGAGPDISIDHHQPPVRSSPRTSNASTSTPITRRPSILNFSNSNSNNSNHTSTPKNRDSTNPFDSQLLELDNAQYILHNIEQQSVDKIYATSSSLQDDAIIHFVKCLCQVSDAEINNANEPRKFSLQKLIEVAYYNMNRVKWAWNKIWNHLATHFVDVGKHCNETIAMHAIDSTRQLSMKFLEQDELADYHFQRDFLKPFHAIITHAQSGSIRDLIVQCVGQMILKRSSNIKSGWKSILQIFAVAARDDQLAVVKLAHHDFVTLCLDQFFVPICQSDAFVDLVNCLVEFAKNQLDQSISDCAIRQLQICANRLANGKVDGVTFEKTFSDNKSHFKVWFPILTGLSSVANDPRIEIRNLSIEILFQILLSHSDSFHVSFWEVVFTGVLFPIFDEIKTQSTSNTSSSSAQDKQRIVIKNNTEWINTSCEYALLLLIRLFCFNFEKIDFLFDSAERSMTILELIKTCFRQVNGNSVILSESLASIGNKALLEMCREAGHLFKAHHWDQLCKCLHGLSSDMNAPTEILQDSSAQDEGEFIRVQCNIQMILLNTIHDLMAVHGHGGEPLMTTMNIRHVQQLLQVLDMTYQSSKILNESGLLHNKRGMPVTEVLNLENQASSVYLNTLSQMFHAEVGSDRRELAEQLLIPRMSEMLNRYLLKTNIKSKQPEDKSVVISDKELSTFTVSIVLVLTILLAFDDAEFEKYKGQFYSVLSTLILSEHKSVRLVLKELFDRLQ